MNRHPLPSQAVLRENLSYDPQTGVFIWVKKLQYRPDVFGKIAGGLSNGYRVISVEHKLYPAHRLAWVWYYGENIDNLHIDHIDLNRANNAINNLRIATRSQNAGNTRTRPNNKLGLKGVYLVNRGRSRFKAVIRINGRRKVLGHFLTPEEASAAYAKAAVLYFGEFARTE